MGAKREEVSVSERCEVQRRRRDEAIARLLATTKPSTTAAVAQPVGKKKKKLVKTRLPPELVVEIMARPFASAPVIPEDVLLGFSDRFCAAYASQKASAERLMAMDADIIDQYNARRYADLEEEVTDNDEEER